MEQKQAFFKAVGGGLERAFVPDVRSKILAALGLTGAGGAGIYGYGLGKEKGINTGFDLGREKGKKEGFEDAKKRVMDLLSSGQVKKAGFARKGIQILGEKGLQDLGAFVDNLAKRTVNFNARRPNVVNFGKRPASSITYTTGGKTFSPNGTYSYPTASSSLDTILKTYTGGAGEGATSALGNLAKRLPKENIAVSAPAAEASLLPALVGSRGLNPEQTAAAWRMASERGARASQAVSAPAAEASLLPALVGSRGINPEQTAAAFRMASERGARASQAGRTMRNVTPPRTKVTAPAKKEPTIIDAEVIPPSRAAAQSTGESALISAPQTGTQAASEAVSSTAHRNARRLRSIAQKRYNSGLGTGLAIGGGVGLPLAGGAYWLGSSKGYDEGYEKGGTEGLQGGLNFGHYLARQQVAQNNEGFLNRLGNLFTGNVSNFETPDFSGLTFADYLKQRNAQQ